MVASNYRSSRVPRVGSSARVTTADGLDQALTAPGFFADPYPVYARLRDESPVHWCEPWQQWVITPYELVAEVIDDPLELLERRLGGAVPRAAPGE